MVYTHIHTHKQTSPMYTIERVPHDEIGAVERSNKSRVDFHVKDALYWLRRSFREILNTFAKCIACYIIYASYYAPVVAARQLFLEFVNFDSSMENTNELSTKWHLVKVYCIRNTRRHSR